MHLTKEICQRKFGRVKGALGRAFNLAKYIKEDFVKKKKLRSANLAVFSDHSYIF
jgi:hypothetical protein